jgi:hypothetical protein
VKKKNKIKKRTRQQFLTIPIGPQLQALWRSPEGAINMRYQERRTKELLTELQENGGKLLAYDDILCGSDYLSAVKSGHIKPGDTVLMFSVDGAQLYRSKTSDCWMQIWIIINHSPDTRYKKIHVLPGTIIPGPNKPKALDSFHFPSLHHLAAIQNEGLKIWDASQKATFVSNPFFLLACADGPAMAALNGFVGHHGKAGCRTYCPLKGRHKPGGSHYYPARLKPVGYTVEGSDHPDVPFQKLTMDARTVENYERNLKFLEESRNQTQYENHRLETGICKPTIFTGLPRRLSIPGIFSLDLMHLPALNVPDLLLKLWRGTFDCDAKDDRKHWPWATLKDLIWKSHGATKALQWTGMANKHNTHRLTDVLE